ncbi:MAG: GNAT family N-acetyltransferase [Treponema sp.]|nr:GNAT family N-acetyltransferase [Treponema sp.]
MIIKELDYNEYKGKKYQAEILSDRYLSIETEEESEGFDIKWVMSSEPLRMTINEDLLSDWLDEPVAYGAFEGEKLIGMVEGFLEKWNNRFRIANICVFDNENRRCGIGTELMNTILKDAVKSGARMAVLETQTFNFKAISFYKKHGFELIGFDRYAYSNTGPEEHNMRVEMGKKL